jgi:hypothetical protein
MATTTPNFGWTVPTSTDLVKDGATAIETLGDAIDASLGDAYVSYTPTWTNLTVGNGTNAFKYKQLGKTVFVKGSFTFGSTSSITGTGPSMSLPFTNISSGTPNILGQSNLTDISAATLFAGHARPTSTTAVEARYFSVSGILIASSSQLTSTAPFTWATGDAIHFNIIYESV